MERRIWFHLKMEKIQFFFSVRNKQDACCTMHLHCIARFIKSFECNLRIFMVIHIDFILTTFCEPINDILRTLLQIVIWKIKSKRCASNNLETNKSRTFLGNQSILSFRVKDAQVFVIKLKFLSSRVYTYVRYTYDLQRTTYILIAKYEIVFIIFLRVS